jgi:hypothetical protein
VGVAVGVDEGDGLRDGVDVAVAVGLGGTAVGEAATSGASVVGAMVVVACGAELFPSHAAMPSTIADNNMTSRLVVETHCIL